MGDTGHTYVGAYALSGKNDITFEIPHERVNPCYMYISSVWKEKESGEGKEDETIRNVLFDPLHLFVTSDSRMNTR